MVTLFAEVPGLAEQVREQVIRAAADLPRLDHAALERGETQSIPSRSALTIVARVLVKWGLSSGSVRRPSLKSEHLRGVDAIVEFLVDTIQGTTSGR